MRKINIQNFVDRIFKMKKLLQFFNKSKYVNKLLTLKNTKMDSVFEAIFNHLNMKTSGALL